MSEKVICQTCYSRVDAPSPKRRFEVVIHVTADDMATLASGVAEYAQRIADGYVAQPQLFGGASSGGSLIFTERPEQTHEKWEAELESWLAAREAERAG